MKYALVDSNNIVQNFIVFNPQSTYVPPFGLIIQQVNDWINLGDLITNPAPTPTPTPVPTPSPTPTPFIPDLSVQLAVALINTKVIPPTDIDPSTLVLINSQLLKAGAPVISIPVIQQQQQVSDIPA